jgi:SAM-dependent methyltransferase
VDFPYGRIPPVGKQSAPSAPSNVEWKRWGDEDPFWGVVSWAGKERDGSNPWTPEDFYAVGKSDWAAYRSRLSNYGAHFGRAVEIGPGAGRFTKHMALDFDEVIGVDVSPGMIKTARTHLTERNIDLRLGDGLTLPVETGTADVAFSTDVFQHFETHEVARSNFREIARVLRPDGCMLIHLPTFEHPPNGIPGTEFVLAARQKLLGVRANIRRKRKLPVMRMLQYSWSWLLTELPPLGFSEIEITIFQTRSGGRHNYVMARRRT